MKNMKKKRILSLLISSALSLSLMAGCTSTPDTNNAQTTAQANSPAAPAATTGDASALEPVELKMYLLGDRSPDFDEVYGKINEILKEKINATISVDFLSWSEHDTKYSLLFSSQEEFDLIFTASSWGHYEQTVALGGFEPLSEEFIQTNAPGIWDVVPELAWSQAKIGGTIYMVPNYQNEFSADVMAVRGDLMKQFGIESITTWDELMSFYKACASNGIYASQGGPFYQHFQSFGLRTTGGAPKSGELVLYNNQDASDLGFYYLLDWDGFTDYCKQMKELADMGAWSSDVLNSNDDRQTGLLTGKTAVMAWNLDSCLRYGRQANEENPGWDVTIVDTNKAIKKQVNPYINNGVAISVYSKNKERAMMALNEFYTNPEVQDLAMLGIEGKHWQAVEGNQYTLLDQSGFGVNNNCNWGWMNDEIRRTEFVADRTVIDDARDTILDEWVTNIKPAHPYDGFNFDSTQVATQMAAVESNIDAYFNPLINGLVDDVDSTIEQFKNALEAAGIRDILTEMERQAAEFLAQ